MKNNTSRIILLLIASIAVSFIFYVQGAKLEEKDKIINKQTKDSLTVELKYKDSMIRYLRDSIHFPASKIQPAQIQVHVPPPIAIHSPAAPAVTVIIKDTIVPPAQTTSSIITGDNDLSIYDTSGMKKNKDQYNTELRAQLNNLCLTQAFTLRDTIKNKILLTTAQNIRASMSQYKISLAKDVERFRVNNSIGPSKTLAQVNYKPVLRTDDYLDDLVDNLISALENINNKNALSNARIGLQYICLWNQKQNEYFRIY